MYIAVCNTLFVSRRPSQLSEQTGIIKQLTAIIRRAITDMEKLFFIVPGILFLALQGCESGSCPPTLSVDVCDATCGPSFRCNELQLCCPTDCGGSMCVDAMTQRHFVTLEKKGRCPELPGGAWICSHTCTGDSDCPRALKCCTNRCGARTCRKPETEVENRQ